MNLKLIIPLIVILLSVVTITLASAEDPDVTPSVVQNINGEVIDNDIILTWDEPEYGTSITKYTISGLPYGRDGAGTFSVGQTSETWINAANLIHEQQYIFWITASNDIGTGTKSSGYSITILAETPDEKLEHNPICNERDNRNKDKCMMVENYIQDYKDEVTKKDIELLKQKNIELEQTVTDLTQKNQKLTDEVKQQRWSGIREMEITHGFNPVVMTYDDTALGDERWWSVYGVVEDETIYLRSAVAYPPFMSNGGLPSSDPESMIYYPQWIVPDWAKGHLTYTIEKPDGQMITNQYCHLEPGDPWEVDTCLVAVPVEKGDIFRSYAYFAYVGETSTDNLNYVMDIPFQQSPQWTTMNYVLGSD